MPFVKRLNDANVENQNTKSDINDTNFYKNQKRCKKKRYSRTHFKHDNINIIDLSEEVHWRDRTNVDLKKILTNKEEINKGMLFTLITEFMLF